MGIAQGFSNGKDILVSAPRLVDENDLIRRQLRRLFESRDKGGHSPGPE